VAIDLAKARRQQELADGAFARELNKESVERRQQELADGEFARELSGFTLTC
jgi:hypothetical protein